MKTVESMFIIIISVIIGSMILFKVTKSAADSKYVFLESKYVDPKKKKHIDRLRRTLTMITHI